ncbi:MAG TPA: SdrD B-like domain-containing protein, partial [Kiritimatiellia bacterium]|nr:SdrD B-like domain-containing protein [Kiritimatiellia bacterium]
QPLFPELAYAGTADNGEVEDYLWHLAGLGDYVWYDVDGDGAQDAGEPPIPGVRVYVDLNADGVWQSTEPAATTDSNGLYGIGGLVPGTYSVRVDASTLPAGVTPTYDLDGIGTPHRAAAEIASLDQFVSTVDFGYAPPVNIGDRVWFDANRDGIQNLSETDNLHDIPVALLDTNGNVVAETRTDSQGKYLFANVPTGTYLVRFDLTVFTTNEMLSPSKVGSDDAVDNDWVSGNASDYAWTAPFSVSGGKDYLDVDLGVSTRSPTRAELAEVWGEWTDGAGRVVWRTDSEHSTAGFFVSRVDSETGAETRLNERLILS